MSPSRTSDLAETFWRKAVEEGDVEAMNNLGSYLLELGDRKSARELSLKASRLGHSGASKNLARHESDDPGASKGELLAFRGYLVERSVQIRH